MEKSNKETEQLSKLKEEKMSALLEKGEKLIIKLNKQKEEKDLLLTSNLFNFLEQEIEFSYSTFELIKLSTGSKMQDIKTKIFPEKSSETKNRSRAQYNVSTSFTPSNKRFSFSHHESSENKVGRSPNSVTSLKIGNQ